MTEDETVRLGSITNSMDVDLSKVWESEGQRSLACCSPWNRKESDTTERLKNNSLFLLWFSPAWSSQRTVKESKWDLHEGR